MYYIEPLNITVDILGILITITGFIVFLYLLYKFCCIVLPGIINTFRAIKKYTTLTLLAILCIPLALLIKLIKWNQKRQLKNKLIDLHLLNQLNQVNKRNSNHAHRIIDIDSV